MVKEIDMATGYGYGAVSDGTGDVRYAAATSATSTDPGPMWNPDPYEQEMHRQQREHEMRKMEMKVNPPTFYDDEMFKVKKTPKTPLDDLRRSVQEWLNPTIRMLSV